MMRGRLLLLASVGLVLGGCVLFERPFFDRYAVYLNEEVNPQELADLVITQLESSFDLECEDWEVLDPSGEIYPKEVLHRSCRHPEADRLGNSATVSNSKGILYLHTLERGVLPTRAFRELTNATERVLRESLPSDADIRADYFPRELDDP